MVWLLFTVERGAVTSRWWICFWTEELQFCPRPRWCSHLHLCYLVFLPPQFANAYISLLLPAERTVSAPHGHSRRPSELRPAAAAPRRARGRCDQWLPDRVARGRPLRSLQGGQGHRGQEGEPQCESTGEELKHGGGECEVAASKLHIKSHARWNLSYIAFISVLFLSSYACNINSFYVLLTTKKQYPFNCNASLHGKREHFIQVNLKSPVF